MGSFFKIKVQYLEINDNMIKPLKMQKKMYANILNKF